jgi:hypothetical protein
MPIGMAVLCIITGTLIVRSQRYSFQSPSDVSNEAMTPDRFRECLAALHWSQRGLAEILYCDDRLVRHGAQGTEPVPESIARWIEKLTQTHEAAPLPT